MNSATEKNDLRRTLSDVQLMGLGASIAGGAFLGLDVAGRIGMFIGAVCGLLVGLAPVLWPLRSK